MALVSPRHLGGVLQLAFVACRREVAKSPPTTDSSVTRTTAAHADTEGMRIAEKLQLASLKRVECGSAAMVSGSHTKSCSGGAPCP